MSGRGFKITMKVPELDKAINQIGSYDGRTALKIEGVVQDSTKNITAGARQRVPVRSGELKKSITHRFEKRTITGTIAARKPHAHLVEFGAKAATVKPATKKALQIPGMGVGGEGGGFASSAQIPKRGERPFMRPAFENERENLISNLKNAVKP